MPPPGACLNIMEARCKKDGYGSLDNPAKMFNQDYHQLKQNCLSQRLRYRDNMFPPDRSSIGEGILKPSDIARIEWLRPAKIVRNPFFVLDGMSRFDFGQGVVGDCWFLASIGALTFQAYILKQVVPSKQTFDNEYCGLFHFRFWRFGKWVDVVIDDKLPTINGRLIFVHSRDPKEFWPALLEKAYAKVCGSYADMNSGTTSEAMVDFTGGVHICIQLSDPPSNLWELLYRACESQTLMSCGTPKGETSANTVLPNGLVQGHAYTITGVKKIISRDEAVYLVRLWNPWGSREWNGNWSDQSSLWRTVSAEIREQCLSVRENGEFWMALEDFCKFYVEVDICCVTPHFLDGNPSSHWKIFMHEGKWVAGITAGGSMHTRDTFSTNPQYLVEIGDQYSENPGKDILLVSLMQKPDKRNRRLVQHLHIGFSVFEVTEQYEVQKGKFQASFFSTRAPIAQTTTSMDTREVTKFFLLKPGEYLIVPATVKSNDTASFLLTIHSNAAIDVYEASDDHRHEPVQNVMRERNSQDDKNNIALFSQHADMYEEVNAEQLQILLNDKILRGDLKSGGFSIDACRSMIALMDMSITGKLNNKEFLYLCNKVLTYKEIFFRRDVSRQGMLSLSELRNAFGDAGMRVRGDMLNLMAVRYGASSGHITLENFISLLLRYNCMCKIFERLSKGKSMTLYEAEWMKISMYT